MKIKIAIDELKNDVLHPVYFLKGNDYYLQLLFIEKLSEKYFGINITLDSEQEIDTVGGMLFFIANKVPKNNEFFTFNNELQLKVVKASDRRIITLEIKKIN